jgi:hypothetical protein
MILPISIRIFAIQFDIPLLFPQIPQWRGAIAEHAGLEDERFHNHQGDKNRFHYRYPTVLYRSRQGKAAIWSFGEGTEALQTLLMNAQGDFTMHGQKLELRVQEVDIHMYQPNMSALPQKYGLNKWLALNEQNFKRWEKLPDAEAQNGFLEQILASNIIAFAKALEWQMPERLHINITKIIHTTRSKHKGILMLTFDIQFEANIFLPTGLGLGKSVSHGYGVLTRFRGDKTRPE